MVGAILGFGVVINIQQNHNKSTKRVGSVVSVEVFLIGCWDNVEQVLKSTIIMPCFWFHLDANFLALPERKKEF